jgi:hypothetical protein
MGSLRRLSQKPCRVRVPRRIPVRGRDVQSRVPGRWVVSGEAGPALGREPVGRGWERP